MKAPATSPVRNGYSTIRTLHWSSTSFGYMNPSIRVVSLANRPVQPVVEHLRSCSEVRLQHLDHVSLQKSVNWIMRILQVRQLPRPGRTRFATRGGQALRDAVVTQGAFLRRMPVRMKKAASVRTCLNAVAAAQAIVVIDQHHTVGSMVGGTHWAYLRAR